MRALGFEPKKEEIRKMISDIDKDGSGTCVLIAYPFCGDVYYLMCIQVQSISMNSYK